MLSETIICRRLAGLLTAPSSDIPKGHSEAELQAFQRSLKRPTGLPRVRAGG